MKLTPEDYLKMRNRCKELERDNLLKQGRILELRSELERLRLELKESVERIDVLNDSIDQLRRAIAEGNEGIKYWADKAHNAQRRISEMIYKGNVEPSKLTEEDTTRIHCCTKGETVNGYTKQKI